MPHKILIVDDDSDQLKVIDKILHEKYSYKTIFVNSGSEAINLLNKAPDDNDIDLVLLDINMFPISGIDVIKAIKPQNPKLPVIVRTGVDDIDIAVSAMKYGADDLVRKTDKIEILKNTINQTIRNKIVEDEILLNQESSKFYNFNAILGSSKHIKDLKKLARTAAKSHLPVLIEGENGVGKGLFSRSIHCNSDRFKNPYIKFNCETTSSEHLETILFGGRNSDGFKIFGKIREADTGTIYLKNIDKLSSSNQVKILRLLEDKIITSSNSDCTIKIDVRLIASSRLNLEEEAKIGNFNAELFYKINNCYLNIAPLKNRPDDIVDLCKKYLSIFCKKENKKIELISDKTLNALKRQSWSGNVSQLKNSIHHAVNMCDSNYLQESDFPGLFEANQKMLIQNNVLHSQNSNSFFIDQNSYEFKTLSNIEKEAIIQALEYYGGHMSTISKKLGIGRSTLYRKLDEYNVKNNRKLSNLS